MGNNKQQHGLFDEDIEVDAADIEQQLATLSPEPKGQKRRFLNASPCRSTVE
ncbi:hypothetical protein [Brenneria rubrifaciens]|uniref:hypothetical protein n=1 Tax=Brenneria rubrifaciens TaxID=55213 RepID=UPI0015860208|nr:hypothetical protein [Brenneria rubrifaciens]